jgi:hypothetical protein
VKKEKRPVGKKKDGEHFSPNPSSRGDSFQTTQDTHPKDPTKKPQL